VQWVELVLLRVPVKTDEASGSIKDGEIVE
jgi:hypothetical protein